MVGAHVCVLPDESLRGAPAVDWVSVGEFDYTCVDVALGKPLHEIDGLAYRRERFDRANARAADHHGHGRFPLRAGRLSSRDLTIPNYFNGYLQHPYLSLYTGRGCKSRCTFCLWPQTIGGHLYRVRSVDSVEAEMRRAKELFPEVKEYFFDDDTLTDNIPRVEEIARRLGKIGITWSCNAKPNVPRATIEIIKANGLRLFLVGYESGNQAGTQQHEEGHAYRHHPPLQQRLSRAGRQDSRYFHSGHAGRDRRDDQGDDRLRLRDGSGDDPGLAGRTLSGNVSVQAGEGEWLAEIPMAWSTPTACSMPRSTIPT